jgi:hypothetical protein
MKTKFEHLNEIESEREEADEVNEILVEQIYYFQRKRESNSFTDADKRAALRLVFAFIDTNIWWLKHKAKKYNEFNSRYIGKNILNTHEILELDANQEFTKSLNFSFKMYGKSTLSGYKIKLTKRNQKLLKEAINIRDGLIHPKTVKDLDVALEKLDKVFYIYPLLGFEFQFARLYGIKAAYKMVGVGERGELERHISRVKEQKHFLHINADARFARHYRN